MSFETISLLLNWLEMGTLFAILFRLSSTFQLIATQRELRRAIHHLGERRAAELGINNAFDGPGNSFDSSSDGRAYAERTIDPPFGPSFAWAQSLNACLAAHLHS